MATKCSILRVSVVLPPAPPPEFCPGPTGLTVPPGVMPLTDDLRYSKVSMSVVLNVLLHCSAKKNQV